MGLGIDTFLSERVAEDETVARNALDASVEKVWVAERTYGDIYGIDLRTSDEESHLYVADERDADGYLPPEAFSYFEMWIAQHIAHFDPERLLADCAAKRAVLSVHSVVTLERKCNAINGKLVKPYTLVVVYCSGCQMDTDRDEYTPADECETLRALAAPYSEHPDFDPSWAMSQ